MTRPTIESMSPFFIVSLLQTATQPALRHPIIIRLALPPAAAVLIDIETSSSSQSKQYAFGS
jgi:hypothetical protein